MKKNLAYSRHPTEKRKKKKKKKKNKKNKNNNKRTTKRKKKKKEEYSPLLYIQTPDRPVTRAATGKGRVPLLKSF